MSSSILSVHLFLKKKKNFFLIVEIPFLKSPMHLSTYRKKPTFFTVLSAIHFIPTMFHSCQSKSLGTVKKESHLYQPKSLLFLETLFSPFHPVLPILPTFLFFRASSHPISLLWSYLNTSNHISLFLL